MLPLAESEAVAPLLLACSSPPRQDRLTELCCCLDNLPLAVELAAARTKRPLRRRSSPALRSARSPHGGTGRRARQRDIWAPPSPGRYQLFTPDEQATLSRVAVFAVAVRSGRRGRAQADLDAVQSLVDKSLLRVTPGRYWLLETIREYALEQLEDSVEAPSSLGAHADYHLRVATAVEAEIRGPKQRILLERLHRELANMRIALAWFLGRAPERALALTLLLDSLWRVRGHLREGAGWFEESLARSGPADVGLRASALRQAGDIARMLGEEPRAVVLYEESLSLERELDRKPGIADALLSLGRTRESLVIFEEIGRRDRSGERDPPPRRRGPGSGRVRAGARGLRASRFDPATRCERLGTRSVAPQPRRL